MFPFQINSICWYLYTKDYFLIFCSVLFEINTPLIKKKQFRQKTFISFVWNFRFSTLSQDSGDIYDLLKTTIYVRRKTTSIIWYLSSLSFTPFVNDASEPHTSVLLCQIKLKQPYFTVSSNACPCGKKWLQLIKGKLVHASTNIFSAAFASEINFHN